MLVKGATNVQELRNIASVVPVWLGSESLAADDILNIAKIYPF